MTAEFASNNTGWFNPDGDDNDDKRIVEDEDDNTGADILMVGGDDDDDELDSEDDMSDVDDPRDDSKSALGPVLSTVTHLYSAYTPTQPLTNPLPRRKKCMSLVVLTITALCLMLYVKHDTFATVLQRNVPVLKLVRLLAWCLAGIPSQCIHIDCIGSSSSSSSTHERHKQNKKPRVQPSGDAGDEYDATILPV
jgi:hypothetical protein